MNYADYAERYLIEHLAYLRALPFDSIERAIEAIWAVHERGATIFLCGNGGSASMASHFAADLSKTTVRPDLFGKAQRFRAVSLADNVALLTAWGNDTAYERIFAEQLRNMAHPGDILFAISGSGSSPNVVAALEAAQELDVMTIGLTGQSGGRLRSDCDICICVDTDAYEHNEPLHSAVFHMITFYLRSRLSAQTEARRTDI
ncbi:MAG: SIS domain-containing protein [Chloroflexales bacterium]|nr:SIS domain-containing protein [Chloroflexales bacterium]